jgi:hypothetical protein
MLRVFISYSRADIVQVSAFAAALRRVGIVTWLDFESLRPGERWKEAIDAAISNANAVLLCLSPMSLESAWTSIELKLAIEKNVRIIPVMIRRVTLDDLPDAIRDVQVLDMEQWPSHHASTYAANTIAAILGKSVPDGGGSNIDGGFDTAWICVGERALEPSDLAGTVHRWTETRVWYRHAITVTDLEISEIISSTRSACRAVVVLGESVDCTGAHVLIAVVAARVGEWRLTVVECGSEKTFDRCAALCRAHHIWTPQSAARSL